MTVNRFNAKAPRREAAKGVNHEGYEGHEEGTKGMLLTATETHIRGIGERHLRKAGRDGKQEAVPRRACSWFPGFAR